MSGPSGHGCRCSYWRLNHCPGHLPSDKQNGIIDTGHTGLHRQEFQRHPGRSAVRGWRLHPRCAGCQFHESRHRHRRRDWNVQWGQAYGGSPGASVKTPAGLWRTDPDHSTEVAAMMPGGRAGILRILCRGLAPRSMCLTNSAQSIGRPAQVRYPPPSVRGQTRRSAPVLA